MANLQGRKLRNTCALREPDSQIARSYRPLFGFRARMAVAATTDSLWCKRAGQLLESLTLARQELASQATTRAVLEQKAASAEARCALVKRQLEAEVTKRESLESQLREAHQTLRETERERAAPVPAPLGAQSSSAAGQKEGVAGSSQSGSLVGFWAQLETQLQVLGPHELLRLR